MKKGKLLSLRKEELQKLARKEGIKNVAQLKKAELVNELTKVFSATEKPGKGKNPVTTEAKAVGIKTGKTATTPAVSSEEERIEEAKYYTGVSTPEAETTGELPTGYGDNKVVLVVRDPYWLHAYWEISPQRLQQAKDDLQEKWAQAKSVLRVYDISDIDFNGSNAQSFFDIELKGGATNWYINVGIPSRSYCVDIGLLTRGGEWYMLARSNKVSTPRDSMSDVVDEEWLTLKEDAEKMYALSGGFGLGGSSLELNEIMLKKLEEEFASGFVSSPMGSEIAAAQAKKRGFWFTLGTELIVYGATEPGARVTLQGKPIALRPDGTFSVRFALPEGEQVIPVTAVSPDNAEKRTITPKIHKRVE